MPLPTLAEIDHDLRTVRKSLRAAGVPQSLLNSVRTRALKTGRRQTGPHKGNRADRWDVDTGDPQYGSETDCKLILLRLYAMMLEFKNAPNVDDPTKSTLEKYLGRPIQKGQYRDPLTKERLDFTSFVAESEHPQHGRSDFHLGHENPKAAPKHTPANVGWRSARSNLIQGDLTLAQARTKFVELIARYFDLGEVKIEPEAG
jgi:hypothetical protein